MKRKLKATKRKIYDRRLESAINTLNKSGISKYNKEKILEWDKFIDVKNYSEARRAKYLGYLRLIAQNTGKDFDKLTKEDVINLVSKLKERNWSEWTLISTNSLFKTFMKWLLGNSDSYPECVKWIKTDTKIKTTIERKDMIEPDDIDKLTHCCKNDRDKLLINLLWESGMRIGELINIKIEDIKFEAEKGVVIEVDGKTGKRTLRLIECVHYLKAYLQRHPNPKTENYLFYDLNHDQPAEYASIRIQLQKIGKRAGLNKPINPHNFRHSRATYLSQYWTESQTKRWFGWTSASRMAGVYVHLTTKDLDNAVFDLYGVSTEKKREEVMVTCEHCGKLTPKQLMFCSYCSQPLNKKMIAESDMIRLKQEIMEMVLKSLESS